MTDCKRRTRFDAAAVGLLLATLLASGCGGAAEPPEKTPPAPVKWETARLVLLEEWTDLLGTTQPLPDHAARITTPVEGRVASVLRDANGKTLQEGQHVEAGTVVVKLDDRIVRANRDRAVATQKALQEELAQAKSAREVAAIDVDRLTKLQSAGQSQGGGGFPLVSPVDVQKTRLSLQDAESKLRATEARLKAGAEDVAALELQLKLHQLAAPHKGRLGRIQVVPGQTLSVGGVAADLVDLEEEVDVLCYAAPSVAKKLRVGQAARLGGFDGPPPPGGEVEGKVVFVADQAEPETTGFAVKVRFPNQTAHLGANVSLAIRVLTQPGKECLAIPESALMEDQDPPGVIIADEDVKTEKVKGDDGKEKEQQVSKARQLQAIIGIRDRVLHQVEIIRLEDKEKTWKGGLEKALFVVEKQQGLQTGDPIKLQEEED